MDFLFLSRTMLFQGSDPEEIRAMLACLGAVRKKFGRGETIYQAGDTVRALGLVLSGSVNIQSGDLWGNTALLSHVEPGQTFAETYACLPEEPLMVSAVADEPSEVLFLDVGRILRVCPNGCAHHSRLIRSLLAASSQKNLNLSRRILHTSPRTIRGRLVAYLSFLASRQGGSDVTVPFDRQQLADYLGVDRSALSAELGKMRREGLVDFRRSAFHLLPAFGRAAGENLR